MNRNEKIFSDLDPSGSGLEIGPSFNPIAPKKGGYNVKIIDHLDQAGLVEKYAAHGVDVSAIEEVDYLWKGELLSDLVGPSTKFDWIIASHVIEHVPNLVTFLTECTKILKPSGTLSLVIPDKRYCFDYFRPISSTGEVLDAFIQKKNRHSPGRIFDYFSSAVKLNEAISWDRHSKGGPVFVHSIQQALEIYDQSLSDNAPYIDIHAWRFTPSSFRLIMHDLGQLGLVGLSESRFYDTTGCEFYVSLRSGQSAVEGDRLQLAKSIQHELAQAILK